MNKTKKEIKNTSQQLFHKQKDTNAKYVCENILNIIYHQGNSN